MGALFIRFIVGGTVVSLFAALGALVKPQRFAGLFGAAPSVALASLALAVADQGRQYAALEARSMIAGALALVAYAWFIRVAVMRLKVGVLSLTLAGLVVWLAVAIGLWGVAR